MRRSDAYERIQLHALTKRLCRKKSGGHRAEHEAAKRVSDHADAQRLTCLVGKNENLAKLYLKRRPVALCATFNAVVRFGALIYLRLPRFESGLVELH